MLMPVYDRGTLNFLDALTDPDCAACEQRREFLRANLVPLAGGAFVAGLITYLIIKGR